MPKFQKPRDYGGDSQGRTFTPKNATYGTCKTCGFRRIYPLKAWGRKTRITCPQCGGYMQPIEHAQKSHPEIATVDKHTPRERRCERCNAKLNSRNPERLCYACSRRDPGFQRPSHCR